MVARDVIHENYKTNIGCRIAQDTFLHYRDEQKGRPMVVREVKIGVVSGIDLEWTLEVCFDRGDDPYFNLRYISDIVLEGEIILADRPPWQAIFTHGWTQEVPYEPRCERESLSYPPKFQKCFCISGTISIKTKPHLFNVVSLAVCNSTHVSRQVAYRKLFNDRKFTDATLILDEDHGRTEFPVHRAILAAHSCYFAELFETRDQEKTYEVIEISEHTMQQFLEFIYTEEIELNVIHLAPLCVAAARFAVEELTKKCCEALENVLTKQTAVDHLKEAEAYGAIDLRVVTIKFMLMKHPELMAKSPKLRDYAEELCDIVKDSVSLAD